MPYNPTLPNTLSDASYLSGDDLQDNFSTLIGNDQDLNGRINSIAAGYNQADLSFSGASLSYSGSTYVSGKPVFLTASAINITGAAGWRYIVCDNAGTITIETIPGGEITSNDEQYTPEPIYNSTHNGYYSSVNTAKRIIGIAYYSGTAITEVISYGSGKNKNDDWYHSTGVGILAGLNNRLQFTASFGRSRGTNISVIDNGIGTTDNEGFRITAEKDGILIMNIGFSFSPVSNAVVTCNKNGVAHINAVGGHTSASTAYVCINAKVAKGDYFTFYVSNAAGDQASVNTMELTFRGF